MFWKKKKEAVDIRDLHRNVPRSNPNPLTQNQDGFVDMRPSNPIENQQIQQQTPSTPQQNQSENFFSFMDDSPTPNRTNSDSIQNNLRKLSAQISELDNKIYKLEQRIELIERKVGVNQVGSAGW